MRRVFFLICVLGFMGSALAVLGEPYIGEVSTSWATSSKVTATASATAWGSDASFGPQFLVNGGAFTAAANSKGSDGVHHTTNPTGNTWIGAIGSYNSPGAGAACQAWVKFTFDQPYYITDIDIWNGGMDSPTATGRSFNQTAIHYSVDGVTWNLLSGANTTLHPGGANGAGSAAWFVPSDSVAMNAQAKYVVFSGISNYGTGDGYMMSEVRFYYYTGDTTKAHRPIPFNFGGINPSGANLTWIAGDNAISHNIYFGTDAAAVNNAVKLAGDMNGDGDVDWLDISMISGQWLLNPDGLTADLNDDENVDFVDFAPTAANWQQSGDGIYKGHYTLDTASYNCGTLTQGNNYYWRVDEVTDTGVLKGDVWNFKTALYVDRIEIIASDLPTPVSGDGGNAWGCNQSKIVRTSSGDIFAIYTTNDVSPVLPDNKTWHLMKRTGTNQWAQVSSGNSGRDTAFLLYSQPQNKLCVTAWANMFNLPWSSSTKYWRPRIWICNASSGIKENEYDIWTPAASNDHGYFSSGINANGNVVFITNQGESSGTYFCWSYSDPTLSSSLWTYKQKLHTPPGRSAYFYLFPGTSSSDIKWSSTENATTFYANYLYKWNGTSLSYTTVRNAGATNYAFVMDSYQDTLGRIHVLYRWQQGGVEYGMRHAMVSSDGLTVLNDVALPAEAGNGTGMIRIFQNATGTFYILSPDRIYTATIGSTSITYSAPTLLNFGAYNYNVGSMFVAVPRGGTVRSNIIDGAFLSGTSIVYFRIPLEN